EKPEEKTVVVLPPPEPPKPEPKLVPEPEKPTPKTPPPPPEAAEHAVIQKSRDPEVEPPPDARFVADENNAVLEETVAAVTNTVRDDERIEMKASQERAPDDAPGADAENELGGVRDKAGDERRPPVEA